MKHPCVVRGSSSDRATPTYVPRVPTSSHTSRFTRLTNHAGTTPAGYGDIFVGSFKIYGGDVSLSERDIL